MISKGVCCRGSILVFVAVLALIFTAGVCFAGDLSQKQSLGKLLFFDKSLSTPQGMSCATCHDPETGFADPRPWFPTSQGIVPTRFGSRNAPTVAYSSYSPEFKFNPGMGPMNKGVYEGGQNWDGSAKNLSEQAKLPFLNPLEMHNPNKKTVVLKVKHGWYAKLFKSVYGKDSLDDPEVAYDYIANAIAAYEGSSEVNQFSSKYDYYLAGKATLTAAEERGLTLFEGQAACARCHRSRPTADGTPPMFTSRHHANVGVPKNPLNPFYWQPKAFNPLGFDFVDLGTGAVVNDSFHYGRFKIPTLRNIAKTAPYMHNGALKDLETIVNFYNTRDVNRSLWGPYEWDQNIIKMDNLGNLGLTSQEVDDIVAFLKTLSDGYSVQK